MMFCSLAVLDLRVGHTMDVLSPFISVLCQSPVHVLMLSIQAVHGLLRLRAPGIKLQSVKVALWLFFLSLVDLDQ